MDFLKYFPPSKFSLGEEGRCAWTSFLGGIHTSLLWDPSKKE